MPKVVIEFDTVEKSLAVALDGRPMANVVGVEIYPRGYLEDDDQGEFCLCISQVEKDGEAGLSRMTHTRAGRDGAMTSHPPAGRCQKAVADAVEFFSGWGD